MQRKRNRKRDEERLRSHLKTRCYICYCTTEEESSPTPCCDRYIHETCLAEAFYNAFQKGNYVCPFCRAKIVPINTNEQVPSTSKVEGHVFVFTKCQFNHDRHNWSSSDHAFYAEPFPFEDDSDDDEFDGFVLSSSRPSRTEEYLYEHFYGNTNAEEEVVFMLPAAPHPPPPPGWHEELERIRNSTTSRYDEDTYHFQPG